MLKASILPTNWQQWAFNLSAALLVCASALAQTSPPCAAPPSGLVAWWPLDGDTADFQSGNSGIIVGNPVFTNGLVGQALFFDGVGDGVMSPTTNSLNVGTNTGFSVELWMNTPDNGRRNPVWEWEDASSPSFSGPNLFVGAVGPGSLFLELIGVGNSSHVIQNTSNLFGPNSWHHVAFTYNRSTRLGRLYFDGAIVTEQNMGSFIPRTTGNLFIGRRAAVGFEETFLGTIDEPSVYDRDLNPAEVLSIFNAAASGKCRTPQPPRVVIQPQSRAVIVGDTTSLSVSAAGTAPLAYQWRLEGNDLSGASQATLTLTAVQFSQAGNYVVVITNSAGSVTSSVTTLTVNQFPTCWPPPSGLVAWWPLDGDPSDFESVNSGIVLGNPVFTNGFVGQAMFFDGVGDGVMSMPTNSLNVGTNSGFSVEMWVNTADVSPHGPVFEWDDTTVAPYAGPYLFVGADGPGTLLAEISEAGNANHHVLRNTSNLVAPNSWHHLALTYSRNTGNGRIYLDGTIVQEQNFGNFTPRTAGNFFIGRRAAIGYEDTFLGRIDEPGVYNRELAPAEIQSIFGANAAGKCKTPVPPSITTQPHDKTVVAGGSVNFSVIAGGSAPLTYQWRLAGVDLGEATNATLTLTNLQASDAGNYSVAIANEAGFLISSNALLTVNAASAHPIYDLSRAFSLDSNPSSEWSYGWESSLGAAFSLLTVPVIQSSENGLPLWSWQLTRYAEPAVYFNPSATDATSNGGQASYPPGTVWFFPGMDGSLQNFGVIRFTLPTGQLGNYRLETGVKPYLNSGSGDTEFHILKNGVEIFGQFLPAGTGTGYTNVLTLNGGDTVDFAIGRGADGREYASGLKISALLTLADTNPVPPSIISQPQSQTVVSGQQISFSVQASGSAPLNYQWRIGGNDVPDASNATLSLSNVQAEVAGNYSVVVTNFVGSITSTIATLVINPAPPCTAPPDGLVAWWHLDGDTTELETGTKGIIVGNPVFTNGLVGQAMFFDGVGDGVMSPTTNSLNVGTNTGFSVEMWMNTPDNGRRNPVWEWEDVSSPSFSGPNLFVGAVGPGSLFLELIGVGNSSHVIQNTSNLFGPNSWHHVAFTYNRSSGLGRLYLDGAIVTEQNMGSFIPRTLGNLFIGRRAAVGFEETFLGSIDEPSVYNRDLNPAEVVSIFNAGASGKCRTPQPPRVVIQPPSRTVIVGETVSLAVTADGTAPLAYQWRLEGNDLSGASQATLTLTAVQFGQAGNYVVVITNSVGSVTSSIATLTVNPLPPCLPAPSGLVAWWPLDGDTSDFESVNSGIVIGNPVFTNGLVGQAMFFDGVGDGVMSPTTNSLNVGTNSGFSVEMWMNTPDNGRRNPVWEWEDASSPSFSGPNLFVGAVGPGSLFLEIIGVGNSVHFIQNTSNLFGPNSWHHVAVTYNRSTGLGRLYLDGAIVTEQNMGSFVPRTTGNLFIGRRSAVGFEETFLGTIDEPSVYTRELSPTELQLIFASHSSGKCKVPVAPTIVFQPQAQTVIAGNTVSFTVIASGTGPLNYQWRLDGVNLAGEIAPSLVLNNVQASEAGGYSVVVANQVDSVTSDIATLIVNPPPPGPPTVLSITANQSVNVGSNAAFTVVASGTPPLSYQWRLNDANLDGAISSTLSIDAAQLNNAGGYRVIVRNAGGSVTSGIVSLTVISTSLPPSITSQPGNREVFLGGSTTFNVVASGTGPLGYQWYFNGVALAGATGSSLPLANVAAAQAGTYWVIVSNPFGSAGSAGAVLNFVGQNGGTVFFALPVGKFVFDVDGTSPVGPGTAFLAQLYAGAAADNLRAVGAAASFTTPGRFAVGLRTVTNVNAGQTASVQVRVWESAYGSSYEQALATGGKTGASIILQVMTGGETSEGNPPPPPLPAPHLSGLQSFSLVAGQVASAPQILTQPASQSVLLGANVALAVAANGPGILHYQWFLNGNAVGGGTAPTIAFAPSRSADEGDYTVVVSNSGGAVTSQVATLTVTIDRVLSVISPPDQNGGALVSVPLQLRSFGDVGGMTFVLHYNPDYLSMPELSWDTSLDGALKQVNVPSLGQIRGIFAFSGTTLPAGTQTLATLNFRARTVLADTTTELNPQVIDVSSVTGDPILYGTDLIAGRVRILAGNSAVGDNNGNGRLDVGDATLLLRLLAQLDTIRSWDITRNDLNLNGLLDSGDVIKILRVVAGIDPQPTGAAAPGDAESAKFVAVRYAASSPLPAEAVLVPLQLHGTNGELVTVQVRLDNSQTAVAGARFMLNYPVAALRLVNAKGLRLGAMVPGGAVAMWNVAPAQNDYASQNGHVTLVVTSPSAWLSNNGVLAELTFQVQPGAAGQYAWPVSLSGVETTSSGYDTRSLASGAMVFIGRGALSGSLSGVGHNQFGQFQFTLNGDAGATYTIEVSTDLKSWSPLTNVVNGTGASPFVDSDPGNFPRRFYRVRPSE